MAILPNTANAGENNQMMNDFSPLPIGKYPCMIVKSDYKENKKKTGHILSLQYKVIEGEQNGRVFFDNLNLDNPNPQTVEIANKTLNSVCDACGKVGVMDSDELHGIPVLVTLGLTKATAKYAPSNKISFIEKYTGTVSPANIETPTNTPTNVPSNANAAPHSTPKKVVPWAKK